MNELTKSNDINALLDGKIKQTSNEKEAIDFLATKTALTQDGTVEKIVNEKTEELKNDAEAKRVKAEAGRLEEEAKKVKVEQEKILAEYEKQIQAKKKEVEELIAESDKAEAYFKANAEILKYIGIRTKKSLRVMQVLMYPASIIFLIVQILLFPLTFVGVTIEAIVNIVGGVCGSIENNAIKMIISIAVILVVVAIVILAYIFGGKLIASL